MRSSVILGLLPALVGCGNSPDTKGPSTTASSAPPSTATATSSASPSTSEPTDTSPDPAEASRRKPFELYNSCSKVVTIIVGKDPKAGDAGRRTAAPSSSIELPRDAAGNQIVWLVTDEKSDPVVKVTVTRGIKRVEVGRSCSTLNAS